MCTCQLNIWRLAKGGHMQKRHKIHLSYNTTHHSLDPSIICILYKMLWISEWSPFASCHPKIQICQLHCQADDSLVSRVQILICTSWPFGPLSNVRTEQRQDRIRQNPDQREGWHSPAPASIRTLTSLQCSDGRQQAARRREARTSCSRRMRWTNQKQGWRMPPQSGWPPRGCGLSAGLATQLQVHCGRASESIHLIWILSRQSHGSGAS